MNTRILIAVVVSMFVCQQVHAQVEEDPEQVEVSELEGTWEEVSFVRDGEDVDTDDVFWHFERNISFIRSHHDEDFALLLGRFSVDPSTMPALFNLEYAGLHGIYELDGDSLMICISRDFRPNRFESSEDYPTRLYVLRRVDDDE